MNTVKKLSLWLVGAALGVIVVIAPAKADDPHNLDIHVSINATKSLSVSSTFYNFGALSASVSSVTATAITVTNTSGVLIETYTVQGANAISDTAGTNWTLAASTGTDQYTLAAQFSNARPTDADGNWLLDSLTTSAQTCSASVFGNDTLNQSGTQVDPVTSTTRSLWFRIKTPGTVTDPSAHTATIVLAVL